VPQTFSGAHDFRHSFAFLYGGKRLETIGCPYDGPNTRRMPTTRKKHRYSVAVASPAYTPKRQWPEPRFLPSCRTQALFNPGKLAIVAKVGTLLAHPVTRTDSSGSAAVARNCFRTSIRQSSGKRRLEQTIATGWGGRTGQLQSSTAIQKISLTISLALTNRVRSGKHRPLVSAFSTWTHPVTNVAGPGHFLGCWRKPTTTCRAGYLIHLAFRWQLVISSALPLAQCSSSADNLVRPQISGKQLSMVANLISARGYLGYAAHRFSSVTPRVGHPSGSTSRQAGVSLN